jgi:hypothetical protein
VSDLRERVPGHSLVDELLRQWDQGTIRVDETTGSVVIDDEAEGWYLGVLGERRVAMRLAEFDSSWTVLHSVPVGSRMTDIDHVLIGPPGVFTLNTKFSPGKEVWVAGKGMFVGGFKQGYVHNSLREAAQASDRLSRASGLTVPVTALIVFVDPSKITHKAPAGGDEYDPPVRVLRDSELRNVALERPAFSREQVARIVAAAVVPGTWHDRPAQSTTGVHITREFEALEAALGSRGNDTVSRSSASPARSGSRSSRAATRGRTPIRANRRRTKRSRRERMLSELAVPIIGFAIVWFWLANR